MIWFILVPLIVGVLYQERRIKALEDQLLWVENDVEHLQVFGERDA